MSFKRPSRGLIQARRRLFSSTPCVSTFQPPSLLTRSSGLACDYFLSKSPMSRRASNKATTPINSGSTQPNHRHDHDHDHNHEDPHGHEHEHDHKHGGLFHTHAHDHSEGAEQIINAIKSGKLDRGTKITLLGTLRN